MADRKDLIEDIVTAWRSLIGGVQTEVPSAGLIRETWEQMRAHDEEHLSQLTDDPSVVNGEDDGPPSVEEAEDFFQGFERLKLRTELLGELIKLDEFELAFNLIGEITNPFDREPHYSDVIEKLAEQRLPEAIQTVECRFQDDPVLYFHLKLVIASQLPDRAEALPALRDAADRALGHMEGPECVDNRSALYLKIWDVCKDPADLAVARASITAHPNLAFRVSGLRYIAGHSGDPEHYLAAFRGAKIMHGAQAAREADKVVTRLTLSRTFMRIGITGNIRSPVDAPVSDDALNKILEGLEAIDPRWAAALRTRLDNS